MRTIAISALLICLIPVAGICQDADLPGQATQAIAKAISYLRSDIAAGGGYLGHYIFDEEKAEILEWWGEGRATSDQNWIQPPGNPTVGFAFLRAWEATGDERFLDAAVEAAMSLVIGQLDCGGWDYIVDHGDDGTRAWNYRARKYPGDVDRSRLRNQATYDDNVTQHATRLLIAVDEALTAASAPVGVSTLIDDPSPLEFRLVPQQYEQANRGDTTQWRDVRTGQVIPWKQVLDQSQLKFSGRDLAPATRFLLGNDLTDVTIHFEFKPEAAKAFAAFTGANVGRVLAIVFDGNCLMAPNIRSAIPGTGIIQMAATGELGARYSEEHVAIHDAAKYALEFFLKSQYAHGGWPQRFPLSTGGYSRYSTFNDNSIADCIDVMMRAWEVYGDQRYYDSVLQAGQFIIDAQLPAPQATWAQQYDEDMKPGWARRFEPPAACAGESVGVMRTLIKIAMFTGDEKYIEPLPAAFDWFARSELSEITGDASYKGKWARFYELKTNKPLYFTRDTYRLTYDDSDMPTHYAFQGSWNYQSVQSQYDDIVAQGLAEYVEARKPKPLSAEAKLNRASGMEDNVAKIIDAQDEKGRWWKGTTLDMSIAATNITRLSDYLRMVNDR